MSYFLFALQNLFISMVFSTYSFTSKNNDLIKHNYILQLLFLDLNPIEYGDNAKCNEWIFSQTLVGVFGNIKHVFCS